MNLALIPARSGSKGLKDKNIKLFNQTPLLAVSIKCAADSGLFDEIFVSTDSQEYADIAMRHGGAVPFLREKSLAGDETPMWDVVRDVLVRYMDMGKRFEMVTLLQPTSPLRLPADILAAHALYMEKNADSVVAVCRADHAPYLYNTLPPDGLMHGFIKHELLVKQRQQFEDYYRVNGALYMIKCDYLMKTSDIYGQNSFAYVMPKERSVDIDDEWDFIAAEAFYFRMGR